MFSARTLRAVADAAASRNYLRAIVTSVQDYGLYGVTVPGRDFEAVVRSISYQQHQVGDLVVLARVNGLSQMLVILDSVGTQGSSATPPVTMAYWPLPGHDQSRSMTGGGQLPTPMGTDKTWGDAIALLAKGFCAGTVIGTDYLIGRTSASFGGSNPGLYCIALDGSAVRWRVPLAGLTSYEPQGAIWQGAWYGNLYCSVNGTAQDGLTKVDISTGTALWTRPNNQGQARSLTFLSDRIVSLQGSAQQPHLVATDPNSGAVMLTKNGNDLLSGYDIWDGEQAIATDGTFLYVLLTLQGTTSQSTSVRLVKLSSDFTVQWAVEVKQFSESVAIITSTPKLINGWIWIGGGAGQSGPFGAGGWVRAYDQNGNLQKNIVYNPAGSLSTYTFQQLVWGGSFFMGYGNDANFSGGLQWVAYDYSGAQVFTAPNFGNVQPNSSGYPHMRAVGGSDGIFLAAEVISPTPTAGPPIYRFTSAGQAGAGNAQTKIDAGLAWGNQRQGIYGQDLMLAAGFVYYRDLSYNLQRIGVVPTP